MKKHLRLAASLTVGAAVALALGSCTYDPNSYYSAAGSYSSGGNTGYGSGYGYGNNGFSTSLFVSTGNARWGYDPYCSSYYDYTRRCYYDPYLYGYYPVGYRPPVIVGVPHPRGYNRSYCPPPQRVTNVTLVNYSNRERAYRDSSYSWAPQARQQPLPSPRNHSMGRSQYQQPPPGNYGGRSQYQPAPSGNFGDRSQYQQPVPSQRNTSPGFWNSRSTNQPSYRPQPQPSSPRGYDRQPSIPQQYNVPVRTAPVPEPSRIQRGSHSYPQNRQPRQQMPTEASRPVPQPRPEPSAPAPVPVMPQAPQVQPSAPAAPPSPAPEVRGLGEGGDHAGRGGGRGRGRER